MFKIGPDGTAPAYQDEFAAGFDLAASQDVVIPGFSRKPVHTDIFLDTEPTDKYYIRIAPRSGLAVKAGIDVLAGVVDTSYKGEIIVVLYNTSPNEFHIRKGDRVAQGVWTQIDRAPGVEVKSVVRGLNGFGSSGV